MKTSVLKFNLIVLAFLVFQCSNDKDDNNNPSCSNPEGLLTYELANQWEEAYKNNQYVAINEALNTNGEYQDDREFLFSLEELKCYLEYVEDKGLEAGYQSSQMGIRVYLGAKNETNDPNFPPKTTVIFVPTVNPDGGFRTAMPSDTFYEAEPKNYGSSGRPPVELEPEG